MSPIDEYTAQAKKVVDTIEYLTLATVSNTGTPWNSPLWYARDDSYNFYFYSPTTTQHAKNIRANGKGFVVIYDSTVPEGEGFGVYMTAKITELSTQKEIKEAIYWVCKKKSKPKKPQDFMGTSPRRIYKVHPKKIWVNDAETKKGLFLDYRVEIHLR